MSNPNRKTAWEMSQPGKSVATSYEPPVIVFRPNEIRVVLEHKVVCIYPSNEAVEQYERTLMVPKGKHFA